MAKLVSLAVLLTVLFVALAVPVLAKDKDTDDSIDLEADSIIVDPNLQTFYVDKQLQAEAGKPTEFIRLGYALNLGTENLEFKTVLHKKAKVTSVVIGATFEERPTIEADGWDGIIPDGVEYTKTEKGIVKIKKHQVTVAAPANEIRYFEIHYLMPAPKFTYTTTINTASDYKGKYTESTSYGIHTFNVLSAASVPNVPGDWDYGVDVVDATGAKQGLRHYKVDRDGDGKIDEIGWLTPKLSEVGGEVGGKPAEVPPTEVANHNFQLVRADNAYVPAGWVLRQTLDLEVEDVLPWEVSPYATVWPYSPFSDEGYDDNSSLNVRQVNFYPIFAVPVNFTTSLDLSFKYKPQFSGCDWQAGIEIMFPEGPYFSDTTHMFVLQEDGSITSDEFVVSSTPDINGWYDISITKVFALLDGPRVARLFFPAAAGCQQGMEFWVDNVLLNADTL